MLHAMLELRENVRTPMGKLNDLVNQVRLQDHMGAHISGPIQQKDRNYPLRLIDEI